MNPDFQRLMNDATRLTQAGDLQAATAAIRAALAGGLPAAAAPGTARYQPGTAAVIDVEAREVAVTATDSNSANAAATDAAALNASKPATCDAARSGAGDQQAHVAQPAVKAASATPSPGSFTAGSHGDPAGRRDYKLYVPPGAGEGPLPLVVMLHGCTQNPDDFAAGTAMNAAAAAQGFYVLYPAQSQKANPQRCWNWFKHNHQQRGRGEPALLAGMTREVMSQHAIDPQRVYVAGLSAGGAMAAILGDAYPDLFAAVGVHSGLATGVAKDLPSALGAMQGGGQAGSSGLPGLRNGTLTHPSAEGALPGAASGVPTIVFHGDADSTVHLNNGAQVIAAAAGALPAAESERLKAVAGRSYTRQVHRAADGTVLAEHWVVHGAPHAWSGGTAKGSYTDPSGPDASAEMVRFFLAHPQRSVH